MYKENTKQVLASEATVKIWRFCSLEPLISPKNGGIALCKLNKLNIAGILDITAKAELGTTGTAGILI